MTAKDNGLSQDWKGRMCQNTGQYNKHCQRGSHPGNGFMLACNFAIHQPHPHQSFLLSSAPLLLYCLFPSLEIGSRLSYFKKMTPPRKPFSISCLLFYYFCPIDILSFLSKQQKWVEPLIIIIHSSEWLPDSISLFSSCISGTKQSRAKQNLPLCIPNKWLVNSAHVSQIFIAGQWSAGMSTTGGTDYNTGGM